MNRKITLTNLKKFAAKNPDKSFDLLNDSTWLTAEYCKAKFGWKDCVANFNDLDRDWETF